MRADGYEIDDKIVDAVISWIVAMPAGTAYKSMDVAKKLESFGVPWLVSTNNTARMTGMPCYEAANRIQQKLRKLKAVRARDNKNWIRL